MKTPENAAIVISVDAAKIQALTHKQRVEMMVEIEKLCEKIGLTIVDRWDTQGFELPGANWP